MCFRDLQWKFVASVGALLIGAFSATPGVAVDRFWSGAIDNDFFTDGNWSPDATAPGSGTDIAIIDGGANLPAVIAASTGTVTIGGVKLGTAGETGGHVIQNGGTLIIAGDVSGEKSNIGDEGSLESSWTMNNDSVILYDDPLGGAGAGLGTDGSGKDLEIGESSGFDGGKGTLVLHDNAVLRISDDLKIANGNDGNGVVTLDGNAVVTVGSGISVAGSANAANGRMDVAGNALVVSGNSAGAGNMAEGRTNEGYLTLSARADATSELTISDTARVYVRTLQSRGGVSDVSIEGSGQLHVFDTFEFSEPDLGVATIAGAVDGPQRTSQLASENDSVTTIAISDNGVMTVDSDLAGSGWSGLALSGGTNRGGNTLGGAT
ncbi:MAG: hypothetical protein ACC645_15235, partial [Pirellulales bacterium]